MNDLIFFDLLKWDLAKEKWKKPIVYGTISFLIVLIVLTTIFVKRIYDNRTLESLSVEWDNKNKVVKYIDLSREQQELDEAIRTNNEIEQMISNSVEKYHENNQFSKEFFDEVVFKLRPAELYFKTINYNNGEITLTIVSKNELDVAEYCSILRSNELVKDVKYSGENKKENEYISEISIIIKDVAAE